MLPKWKLMAVTSLKNAFMSPNKRNDILLFSKDSAEANGSHIP